MFAKKLWSYIIYLLLGCILYVSLWQIVSGPGPPSAYIISTASISSLYNHPMMHFDLTDYGKLINLRNFSFNILSTVCNYSSPLLLVLVHSSPLNDEKRITIRETWGRSTNNVKVIFLLGKVSSEKLQMKIEMENSKYEDLVQGNFLDSYRNMTYKHVMAFKYTVYYCSQAKYILKTDDDIFVNMHNMLYFLNKVLSSNGTNNLLFCTLQKNSRPKRSYRSKWRVSFSEYPYRNYPYYCQGWALLYSPDVVFILYEQVQTSDYYFWIDDVFITGILAYKLRLNHTNVVKPLKLDLQTTKLIVSGKIKCNSSKSFLYAYPDLKENEIRALWSFVNS